MANTPNWQLLADLALALVSSAYGRGQADTFTEDPAIREEARAIDAIQRGDAAKMERCLAALKKRHAEEWAELERQFGPRAA